MDGLQSLAEVKQEILDRIDGVDRKVEAVEQRLVDKIDKTRGELTNVINTTAIALEHHMDKKIEDGADRSKKIAEATADAAVERVAGTIYEQSVYNSAVSADMHRSLEDRLEKHISNENVHLPPGSKPR